MLLALTEITETWDVLVDGSGDDWWDDKDDEETADDDGDTSSDADREGELGQLIDDSIKLTYRVEEDSSPHHLALSVDDGEVCAATATSTLKPYSSDYEGSMGN